MGSIFKPKTKNVTTTQESQRNPWSKATPGLESSLELIEQGLEAGPYQGLRVAPITPDQQRAIDLQRGLVSGANPLLEGATQTTLGGLNFQNPAQAFLPLGFAGAQGQLQEAFGANVGRNPFLEDRYQQAADRFTRSFREGTQPSLASQLSVAGRLRGSGGLTANQFARTEETLGDQLRRLETDIFSPAYETDRARQIAAQQNLLQTGFGAGQFFNQAEQLRQGAASMAPGMREFAYADPTRLMGIGTFLQNQRQRELLGELEAFDAPFQLGQRGIATLTPLAGQFGQSTGSTTTPYSGPSMGSQLLGLAGTAAGAYFGGPMGASIGGSLGGGLGGGSPTGFALGPTGAGTGMGTASLPWLGG